MSKQHQQHINKYFPNRGILYQPGLSLVFNSINVGIMLSQLLYWHGLGGNKDGWIYKTMEEMKAETGLTRTMQETAIRICLEYQLFEYKLAGIPAKRYFRLNIAQLENLLPGLKQNAYIVYPNPPRQFAENQKTITENTHKTTTINTNRFVNKSSVRSMEDIIKSNYPNLLNAEWYSDLDKD